MTKNEYLLQLYLDGKLPNSTLRMYRGKPLVVKKPVYKRSSVTEKQLATRDRFREAAAFGQSVIRDPIKKATYEPWCKKDQPVYQAAMADFMHAPQIHSWNLDGYHRRKGDRIYIHATDNVCVTKVVCRIRSLLGYPLEEGYAEYQPDVERWEYVVQKNHGLVAGGWFLFKAWDLAGNSTIQRVRYSRQPG